MNWWVFAWLLFLTGAEFVAVMAARFTLTRVERLELWVKTFTDKIAETESLTEYCDYCDCHEETPPENRNAREVNSHGVPIVRERGRGETAGNPTNVPNPVEKKNARNARNTPENPETGQ